MNTKKTNCWEYMLCGREPGGKNALDLGVCPASEDASFDGINSGKCGGRFCWALTGTLCEGKTQGTFAEKRDSCATCIFYKRVNAEEGTANLRTKFLRFVTSNGSLINNLGFKHIKKGTRFLFQGETGDEAYIIQRGACIELVEKEGELHPVGHRGEGDIVGMMSLITDEPRTIHVEAETDMDLWVIHRSILDHVSEKDPDLTIFLTEIIADRFDSKRPTADRTIGKYIATDIIGRGGYSIVYKGIHSKLKLPVAIKMLRHDLALQPDFLDLFHNEARIIASLNHENIVKVIDIEERYRTVFIIMDHLVGESLAELLRRLKKIPSQLAAVYIYQVCSALAYAGKKGLIHRDVNPKNIIILPDDRIKLIDFGLSCPSGTDDFYFGGELSYVPPEVLDGDPADERSDIYSLGTTFFEIVTGLKPYFSVKKSSLMEAIRNQDVPDPVTLLPDIPELQRKFIVKACQRDPDKRYQHASQALEALRLMVEDSVTQIPTVISSDQNQVTISLSYKNVHQDE